MSHPFQNGVPVRPGAAPNGCTPPQPSSTQPPEASGNRATARAMSQFGQYGAPAVLRGRPPNGCTPPKPSSVTPPRGPSAAPHAYCAIVDSGGAAEPPPPAPASTTSRTASSWPKSV